MSEVPVHVIIPTHTPRHLRPTLLALGAQRRRPDSVVVSCDNDLEEIVGIVRRVWEDTGLHLSVLLRRAGEVGRLAQVRNNAVRHLVSESAAGRSRLLFLDGDCLLEPEGVARHAALASRGDVVVSFRVNLSESQTAGLDEAALSRGEMPTVSASQARALARRHRRYERQLVLRRFGLSKAHKPKILGGHHSVSLAVYLRVNGHDESYTRWGMEDDDFCRRAYAAGARPCVAVRDILAFHLYHPTRAPGRWEEAPNASRFRAGGAVRCERGVEHPEAQHEVRTVTFGGR